VIEKYCHIPAFDPINGQQVFVLPTNDIFEKTASIVKQAQVSDEIAQVIDGITPESGHRYVLVNGIGSGEFWSSNKNGDYFPELGLSKKGSEYGYETFMQGHNFIHHENKDPMKAVGTIKAAHYNPRMHRCELVLDTDMNKLATADPAIYEKVANGEPVDVSMGSKCDFDVCSICSNRASNRSEYCSHLKTAMNQILDDGRKVYAYTPHPRFFDMSYVTKGADVTAKALHYLSKAASAHSGPGTEPRRTVTCPDPALHETAECEPSYTTPYFTPDKLAAVTILEVVEPGISSETIDEMAKVGFHEALSTCSHLGIVLKPEEYQRLTLICLGEKEAAEKAEAAGAVIDPSDHSWFDPEIKTIDKQTDPARFSPKVASLVCDHIQSRSVFEPYFSTRLDKASKVPARIFEKLAQRESIEKNAASFMTPEIAAALALGYVVYRKGVPKSDIEAVRKAIHDPKMAKKVVAILVPLIAAGSVIDHMLGFTPPTGTVKKAGIGTEVVLPVAGSYLYSAYARRKAERGRRVSGLEHMFIDYPLPMAVGGVAGIQALKRKFGRTTGKTSGIISDVERRTPEMEKDAVLGGMVYALGSGIYRPRASGAIGYAVDESIASALGLTLAGLKKLVSGNTKVQD
jgi:hypothetical protein